MPVPCRAPTRNHANILHSVTPCLGLARDELSLHVRRREEQGLHTSSLVCSLYRVVRTGMTACYISTRSWDVYLPNLAQEQAMQIPSDSFVYIHIHTYRYIYIYTYIYMYIVLYKCKYKQAQKYIDTCVFIDACGYRAKYGMPMQLDPPLQKIMLPNIHVIVRAWSALWKSKPSRLSSESTASMPGFVWRTAHLLQGFR